MDFGTVIVQPDGTVSGYLERDMFAITAIPRAVHNLVCSPAYLRERWFGMNSRVWTYAGAWGYV